MAGPDRRQSSGAEGRRSNQWTTPPMQVSDDDDEYALAAMGISDGFRPPNMSSNAPDQHSFIQFSELSNTPAARQSIIPPPRPSSATRPKVNDSFALRHDGGMGNLGGDSSTSSRMDTAPRRPLSTRKPKDNDSFALRHDGGMGVISGNSSSGSASNTVPSRTSSVSSVSETFIRSEGSYHGPSGPSFPYQMYPQESRVNRTASIATTVTPSERSYAGPTGPTHPYGMYPQGTVADSISGHEPAVPPIPVGFPGSNNNYQRRIGPEGEEIAGIIGPDGHTEELPPYTKYPDEAFVRKARLAGRQPIAGAGGMGLATRNPEFSSQDDLANPSRSRESIQSYLSTSQDQDAQVSTRHVNSGSSIRSQNTNLQNINRQTNSSQNTDLEPGISEKKPLKKWQKLAKKRVCRIIPVWAIVLAAIVLILFALIMGVTLRLLKPKNGKPQYYEDPAERRVESMTRTFDAAPLTRVPLGISALPTGTYALPLSIPSAIQNSCLTNPAQSRGWSCNLPQSPLQMQILDLPGVKNQLANKEIILDYGKATMRGFPYGTQPPVLDDPLVLNLVIDQQDPQRGPAWFFQTIYNKVVVVPEDLLSSPYDQKRDLNSRDGVSHHHDELPSTDSFIRRGSAQTGSTPWFCYWNGTLLEAFLYVNQTSSEAAHAAQHATTASLAPSSTSISNTPSRTGSVTATRTPTASSSIVIGAPNEEYTWGKEHEFLSAYPKVLKFQERRLPQGAQAIPPYCTKRFIAADGTAQDVTNSTGSVVTLYLSESVPRELQPMKRAWLAGEFGVGEEVAVDVEVKAGKAEVKTRRSDDEDGVDEDASCGCVWVAN